jgi:hypothetical protein
MEFLNLLVRRVKSRGAMGKNDDFKFTVTHEGEYRLLVQVLHDPIVPEAVRSSVMWKGVRAAFPKLFGFDVEWDAEKDDLVKKEAV